MAVTRRVGSVLRTLPKEVTPVNLEELRRVKQLLVELESKADLLRWGPRVFQILRQTASCASLAAACQSATWDACMGPGSCRTGVELAGPLHMQG